MIYYADFDFSQARIGADADGGTLDTTKVLSYIKKYPKGEFLIYSRRYNDYMSPTDEPPVGFNVSNGANSHIATNSGSPQEVLSKVRQQLNVAIAQAKKSRDAYKAQMDLTMKRLEAAIKEKERWIENAERVLKGRR